MDNTQIEEALMGLEEESYDNLEDSFENTIDIENNGSFYENYGTLEALLKRKHYPREKQKELILAAQNGDKEAANDLVLSNTKLVAKIARHYSTYTSIMDYDDYIIEGTTAIYRAIEQFDVSKINEIAFSTYATFWIRQAIGRYISYTTPAVRLPVHLTGSIYTLKNRIDTYKKQTGYDPSEKEIEEICKENNIPYNLVKNGINAIGSTSLYTRIGEDQETDLLDCLADHDTNVEKEAISNLYSDFVIDSISDCLSERELIVIKKRMGYGCEHMTLEMVGAELGVTRERIRQIENSAFKKIHERLGCRPALKQALRDDLDMYT